MNRGLDAWIQCKKKLNLENNTCIKNPTCSSFLNTIWSNKKYFSRSSQWCSTGPWTRTTTSCTKSCFGLQLWIRRQRFVRFEAPSSSSTTTTTTTTSSSCTPWATRSPSQPWLGMTCRFVDHSPIDKSIKGSSIYDVTRFWIISILFSLGSHAFYSDVLFIVDTKSLTPLCLKPRLH